jgi:LmeA-like phospholipid-binding
MTGADARALRKSSSGSRRKRRRWIYVLAAIVVILVILDFAAKSVAENVIATKIQHQGLQHKPDVTIDGFPFLTQVASRDLQEVHLTDVNQVEGAVTITSLAATGRNIRLNSYAFSGGTIGSLSGTALISFASLARALTAEVGPLASVLNGAGLNLTDAGDNNVRASLNVLIVSGEATWHVTRLSANQLNIRLVGSSGLPGTLLDAIQNITLTIPKLPLGLTIGKVQVTPAGVVGHVKAANVPFGS